MKVNNCKVSMGYTVKENQRYFSTKIVEGGKVLKSKTFSIGRDRNEDEAYAATVDATKELAKKYKIKQVTIRTKADLLQLAKKDSTATGAKPMPIAASGITRTGGDGSATNPLVERFGNLGQFKSLIKHALKLHGWKKVKEVLESGLTLIQEAEKDQMRESKVISTANRKIAEAIFAARKEGVQMPAPNSEVEELIEIISRETKRDQKAEKPRMVEGFYKLKDEKWDGSGQMPASFTAYLKEDESHDLLDLKVAS